MNTFKQGDKVRFIDNELNRAECIIYMDKVLIVNKVCVDGLLFLHNTNIKDISDLPTMMYHHSRFELVPDPPKYQVGDYAEHNDSKEQAIITHIASPQYDSIEVKFLISEELEVYTLREFEIEFHVISPSEVVLDFENGIKGRIQYCVSFSINGTRHASIKVFGEDGMCIALIHANRLTEPMKSIVLDLIKAQEQEKEGNK